MKTNWGKYIDEKGYPQGKWRADAIKALQEAEDLNAEHPEIAGDLLESVVQHIINYHVPKRILREIKSILMSVNYTAGDEVENWKASLDALQYMASFPHTRIGHLMPDACPAGQGAMPVGGVITTKNAIYPKMHSADICCSVAMSCSPYSEEETFDWAVRKVHFGAGGRDDMPMPDYLADMMQQNELLREFIPIANSHFGTQGDGNHFFFVGKDWCNHTVIATHHGSRGMGAKFYKKMLRLAVQHLKKDAIISKDIEKNPFVYADSELGKQYYDALRIIAKYTEESHRAIHRAVTGGNWAFRWNPHNFVFKEGDLFHHAKGATPMYADGFSTSLSQRLVPLNMKDGILVLSPSSSSWAPHGAGRNMSRSKYKAELLENTTLEEQWERETEGIRVHSFSGKPDVSELPSAYKSAEQIIAEVEKYELGEVVDIIKPYGSIMNGEVIPHWKSQK